MVELFKRTVNRISFALYYNKLFSIILLSFLTVYLFRENSLYEKITIIIVVSIMIQEKYYQTKLKFVLGRLLRDDKEKAKEIFDDCQRFIDGEETKHED